MKQKDQVTYLLIKSVSNLIVSNREELFHHFINIVVLQVRVISDGGVTAGLIPAKAFWGVIAIRQDPCWVGEGLTQHIKIKRQK